MMTDPPNSTGGPSLLSRAYDDLSRVAAHGLLETALSGRSGSGAEVRKSAVLILLSPAGSVAGDGVAGAVDVLLTQRSRALRHHPGQVAFPGGGIDPGEDAPSAAVREAHEECAVDPDGVSVIGQLAPIPLPYSQNLVTPVLGWQAVPGPLIPDGIETETAFRVNVAHLINPKNRGVVRLDPRPSRDVLVETPAFDLPTCVVWGFTAFVLDALLTELGWSTPWDRTRMLPLTSRDYSTNR